MADIDASEVPFSLSTTPPRPPPASGNGSLFQGQCLRRRELGNETALDPVAAPDDLIATKPGSVVKSKLSRLFGGRDRTARTAAAAPRHERRCAYYVLTGRVRASGQSL